jgi:hypothetical protein
LIELEMTTAQLNSTPFKRAPARLGKGKGLSSKQKRIIQQMLEKDMEVKYVPTSTAATAVTYAGTITLLSNIAQGQTDLTRVGDSAIIKSVEINCMCQPADAVNMIRLIVFQWHSPSAPTPIDVLSEVSTTRAPLSAYQHDLRDQFTVFIDELFVLDTTAHPIAAKIIKKFKGWSVDEIQFQGASITQMNGIYMLWISDSSAVTHPTATWFSNVEFTDG